MSIPLTSPIIIPAVLMLFAEGTSELESCWSLGKIGTLNLKLGTRLFPQSGNPICGPRLQQVLTKQGLCKPDSLEICCNS